MALVQVDQIWYDTESKKLRIVLRIPVAVSYTYDPIDDGEPLDYFTSDVDLKNVTRVGSYRPASIDGVAAPSNVALGELFGDYTASGPLA